MVAWHYTEAPESELRWKPKNPWRWRIPIPYALPEWLDDDIIEAEYELVESIRCTGKIADRLMAPTFTPIEPQSDDSYNNFIRRNSQWLRPYESELNYRRRIGEQQRRSRQKNVAKEQAKWERKQRERQRKIQAEADREWALEERRRAAVEKQLVDDRAFWIALGHTENDYVLMRIIATFMLQHQGLFVRSLNIGDRLFVPTKFVSGMLNSGVAEVV